AWMRRYLGEDETAPIRHPAITSAFQLRVMGMRVPDSSSRTAAAIIPSVGCPLGCNFCTTSAFFGGKGKFVNFYESGDELFDVMLQSAKAMGTRSFFMMDENFLLNRPRAMQLLARMKQENKPWALYVFSSANAIRKYTMQELVELGVSWIWMGLESPRSGYAKLNGADTLSLTRELRQHGIKTLGSTIVGMEHHTPENIRQEVEHAIAHQTDFHQFMLYTPVPGTPLFQQMMDEGRLLDVDLADIHGQYKFNFRHPAISRDDSKKFLDWAFLRDFERNGPSIYRICQTMLQGWKRYKNHDDARVRARFEWEVRQLKSAYNASLWAMEKRLKHVNGQISQQIKSLRKEVEQEFGVAAQSTRAFLGPLLLWASRREDKRLARGKTYEPPTFVERRNWLEA
ncbi:MAG: B12-binding domain-containing radical SAM protein, partial [Terriglobales bacterium]